MLRNIELEPIEDKELEELIKKSLTEISDYLMSIASPENKKLIQERLPHINAVIKSPYDKNAYKRINGTLNELKSISSIPAFATHGNIYMMDDKILSDQYVYLQEDNSIFIIKHELVHALSAPNEIEKVNDNTHVGKVGLNLSYEVARKKDLSDTTVIYADGVFLNEGMTNYLVYLSEGKGIQAYNYIENTILAKFLVGANIGNKNDLIQAFLSDKVKDIENFAKDFDSHMKDENITYNDYAQFNNTKDGKDYIRLLKGAMTYRFKTAKTPDEKSKEISFYQESVAEITKLRKDLADQIIEKEQDNDFDITTQSIGEATASSPTEIKKEAENIETREMVIKTEEEHKGIENNGE